MTGAEQRDEELDWGAEAAAPPRRRIPRWLAWTCGSGCLLFTLVLAVCVFAIWRWTKVAQDPEQAWPAVAEYLHHEQRPDGWNISGAPVPFMDLAAFTLFAPDGGEVRVQSFGDAQIIARSMDPDSAQNKNIIESVGLVDPQLGTITLQGREVPCLRFRAKDPTVEDPEGVPTVRIDATGQGAVPVMIEVRSAGPAPIPDERAAELLAPFDLWYGR